MSSYWARKAQSYNSSGKQSQSYNSSGKQNRYFKKQTPSTPATPPPPLGPLLKSLRVNDLDDDPDNQHSATIQDCELVASYNWLDTSFSEPTILIPGKPPLWSPPSGNNTPPQLLEDSGTYHRDRNAARYPSHPLEPALITCLRSTNLKPSSLIPSLDIVACSSTLGNLLRFVRGGQDKKKTFRILVEKVGNTVFFVRRENSPTETIPDVRGYGHAFPEAYTTWEREIGGSSSSHQRVLAYGFGGLRFLVRFEADGYVRDEVGARGGSEGGKVEGGGEGGEEEKDVEGLLSSLKVSSSDPTATSQADTKSSSSSSPTLTIKESSNTLVPQSQIFDLKTRSIRARGVKDTLSEELPRLWISQIPRFILAYHTRGLFRKEDMEIKDVREDVKRWEKEQSEALGKLVRVLKWIREVVGEVEGGKMEVVHREDAVGVLEVREQGWLSAEEMSLDGGKDGNGDKEEKKKKGLGIKGDKVMSDAIRAEWIKAQAGATDEKSDTREKKKKNTEKKKKKNTEKKNTKKEDVRTQEKGQHDGDTNDDDDESDDGWGKRKPMSSYLFNASGYEVQPPGHNDDFEDDYHEELAKYFGHEDDYPWQSDNLDFTACSKDCAYCGRCPY